MIAGLGREDRERAFELLHWIYTAGAAPDGVVRAVQLSEAGRGIGAGAAQIDRLAAALVGERFLSREPRVGEVQITAFGVCAVARALALPLRSTGDFPALNSFFALEDAAATGLNPATLQTWLAQLQACRWLLGTEGEAPGLSEALDELERRLLSSTASRAALLRALVQLRASLDQCRPDN